MSEKYERFATLAEKRVNNAITSIRSVGKLTNKTRYEYTDKDVRKIYTALKAEIDAMRDALQGNQKEQNNFRLR